MKILVTGAAGFVGKKIVEELLRNDLDVFTCGRRKSADLPNYFLPNYFSVDISLKEEVSQLKEKLPGIDAVIHSAGLAHQFKAPKDPYAFQRVNVEGTRNIAEMAVESGCKKFVHISSISVYGDNKPNPCNETAECHPSDPYAISKYEAEKTIIRICETSGIDLTILRLATVYGIDDVGNVLRLIKLIDKGKFFWTGSGGNGKSLINNADAARAAVLALKQETTGANIFNVTDEPHTMKEIVETIASALGKKVPSISVPPALIGLPLKLAGALPVVGRRARGFSSSLKKWLSDDVLDGSKMERELGFKSQISLSEGIAKEVDWYRKNCK